VGQTAGSQETLRRLAMIGEGFAGDAASSGSQERGTAARGGVGGHRVSGCVPEWSIGRALAAGVIQDEMPDMLLSIAPVAGLGRVVCAAPDVAIALGYDIAPRWRNRTITGNSGLGGRRRSGHDCEDCR
jgi:hypothetical protein